MGRLPRSIRPIFNDPVPDGEPVDSRAEAEKRAGFVPRLLKTPAVTQWVFIHAVDAQVEIDAAELSAALRDAKATDLTVPPEWNGVVISLHQNPGVLTDYGEFFIAQAPPVTITAPQGFPLDQLFEIVFRITGVDAAKARTLRQEFAKAPASFFPIGTRYEMDNRQVRLASGNGLILQNAEKGAELALMWSDGDRSFFLTGLLSEEQAIATGNALR